MSVHSGIMPERNVKEKMVQHCGVQVLWESYPRNQNPIRIKVNSKGMPDMAQTHRQRSKSRNQIVVRSENTGNGNNEKESSEKVPLSDDLVVHLSLRWEVFRPNAVMRKEDFEKIAQDLNKIDLAPVHYWKPKHEERRNVHYPKPKENRNVHFTAEMVGRWIITQQMGAYIHWEQDTDKKWNFDDSMLKTANPDDRQAFPYHPFLGSAALDWTVIGSDRDPDRDPDRYRDDVKEQFRVLAHYSGLDWSVGEWFWQVNSYKLEPHRVNRWSRTSSAVLPRTLPALGHRSKYEPQARKTAAMAAV
ncbi:hypothetical protein T439DRAFT_326992 [Meredithblackwellia eburnea MCA 4105]